MDKDMRHLNSIAATSLGSENRGRRQPLFNCSRHMVLIFPSLQSVSLAPEWLNMGSKTLRIKATIDTQ